MGWRSRDRRRRTDRQTCEVGVDALEGRILLSAMPARPPLPGRSAAMEHLRELQARRTEALAYPAPAPPIDPVTLNDQVSFAYQTVQDGQRIAHSRPVRDVGLDYAKLSVSNDARKVGAAYLTAALRGDGKDLQRLGKTPLVQKVGDRFHKLSESSAVQKLGSAFEKFGKSVAKEFKKLFSL